MRHFTNRSVGWIAMAAWLATSLPVQAATILDESFDGASKTSLLADGWVIDDQGRATFSAQSGDAFIQLAGVSDGSISAAPKVSRPFGNHVRQGAFHAVLGSASSAGNITLRLMDGTTTLFSLYIPNHATVTVNSQGKTDTYTDLEINSFNVYADRLDAVFSWQVASDGTGGTFSFTLTQPDPNHTATAVNTELVTGRSFLADGVPDRIELELGKYDVGSRVVRLYQLDAQSTVPEPGTAGLLGLICAGALLRRHRKS